MTKHTYQLLRYEGFLGASSYNEWAYANSIDHYIQQEDELYIVDDTWVLAYTLPLRSWENDAPHQDQMRPGAWGDARHLWRRRAWRWYLLRVPPEAFGYQEPTVTQDAVTLLR